MEDAIGVSSEEISERYPVLYHMAASGSWSSIQAHGLLSTSRLLDLFEVSGAHREALECAHRPESVTLHHPVFGGATIRDQKPMSDRGLTKALQGALTPTEWYRILNDKVFFWVTKKRLMTLLGAGAYRKQSHDVLEVDTAGVLRDHLADVRLAGMNTGATAPFPHVRGRDTFLPLATYPFHGRLRSKKEPVVEFAVKNGVRDVASHVLRVYSAQFDRDWQMIWERGR